MNITKIFSGEAIYDWGGGLVWLQIKGPFKDGPKILRKTVQEVGGHATLFGAPEQIRRKTPIFHPQKEPLRGLTERIKTGFDPLHILNPSKMYEGI